MARYSRSVTQITIFFLFVACTSAQAKNLGTLGARGPLVSDATGNWQEFRTSEEDVLSGSHDDVSCVKRLPQNLRRLFFEHFRYYADHSKEKIGDTEIARFGKVLGMATHESGGASAAVTDMSSKGSRETLRRFYNVDNPGKWAPAALYSSTDTLDHLLALETVRWDKQTNFGLLQMSADRLAVGGTSGIAAKMITDMKTLYVSHPEEVIERCGTRLMYKDAEADIRQEFDQLQHCQAGYTSKESVQCFGRWATLCPNYNIELALIAPPAYFATRRSAPLCEKTFRRILKSDRAYDDSKDLKKPLQKVKTSPSQVTSPAPFAAPAVRPSPSPAPTANSAWPPFFGTSYPNKVGSPFGTDGSSLKDH